MDFIKAEGEGRQLFELRFGDSLPQFFLRAANIFDNFTTFSQK
jgi:hypothetical protein